MKEVLKKLATYQIQALDKGIDFDIDLCHIKGKKEINVKLSYMTYSNKPKNYQSMVTSISFTPGMRTSTKSYSLDKIEKFIQNVTINPEEL